MSAIVAHWPFVERHHHRSRHANAHFRWKVNRPWIPMLAGIGLMVGLLAIVLALSWWSAPGV
ncbi:MAG: hypothetical protein HOP29_19165 [Phycisphaerales bacterium]|nr:hypothetical protein [Phycisphaerales bacterium]